MSRDATLPARAIVKILDTASEAGVDDGALRAASGIEDVALDDPSSVVTLSQVVRMYEEGAKLSGDGAFGLHVGERWKPDIIGYTAMRRSQLPRRVRGARPLPSRRSRRRGHEPDRRWRSRAVHVHGRPGAPALPPPLRGVPGDRVAAGSRRPRHRGDSIARPLPARTARRHRGAHASLQRPGRVRPAGQRARLRRRAARAPARQRRRRALIGARKPHSVPSREARRARASSGTACASRSSARSEEEIRASKPSRASWALLGGRCNDDSRKRERRTKSSSTTRGASWRYATSPRIGYP